MKLVVVIAALVACKSPPTITREPVDAAVLTTIDAASDAPAEAAPAAEDAAIADAESDACVPTDTWDAKVQVRNTWRPDLKMTLPGPLELVLPRIHVRKEIFPDCGMTGGGCGDCSKPHDPNMISCDLTPTRAHVEIGVDDVGPTSVDVVQRGDTIVAEWTLGATHRSEILYKLPCAVHVRFVR